MSDEGLEQHAAKYSCLPLDRRFNRCGDHSPRSDDSPVRHEPHCPRHRRNFIICRPQRDALQVGTSPLATQSETAWIPGGA